MKKTLLVIAVSLFLPLSAELLTLESAIDKALQNYPDIQASSLKIESATLGSKSATSAYLPQINLNANYNLTQTYVFPVAGQFNTIDNSSWSVGVNLKQKIWDFKKTTLQIEATDIDKSIAKLSLEDSKALLAYKVKSLYQLIVLDSEAIKVHEKDILTKEAYYEQAKALVKEGLKTDADASRFLSALYGAKDSLANSQTLYAKAKNSLSLYMGEAIIDKTTFEHTTFIDSNSELNNNIEKQLLEKNYQLKIAQKSIEKNHLLHKSMRASHFGSVDAIASYTHLDTLNSYDSKLAGIVLNVPLYTGGKTSAEVEKAQVASNIALAVLLSKKLQLQEEIESLLLDLAHFYKTLEAKEAQLHSAQQTQNVLDARYKEGLATYIEVLDASSVVLSAELALLETEYQISMVYKRVEYLEGKIK